MGRRIKRVFISFESSTSQLSVSVADDAYLPLQPVFTAFAPLAARNISLASLFLGFTAATGVPKNIVSLRVYNWRFYVSSETAPPPPSPRPFSPSLPSPTPRCSEGAMQANGRAMLHCYPDTATSTSGAKLPADYSIQLTSNGFNEVPSRYAVFPSVCVLS